MKENVTVWNTSTPRIQLKYSGGPENVTLGDSPENVTVPGYGNTPQRRPSHGKKVLGGLEQ